MSDSFSDETCLTVNPVREFQNAHQSDIAAANGWAADAGFDEEQWPGTVIQWFADMDTTILRERSKTIEQLGAPGVSPFEYVFGPSSPYASLSEDWNTGDAEAFFAYCGDGVSAGLKKYLTDLREIADSHYDSIISYIETIEDILHEVSRACSTHLGNFEEELGWADLKVLFGLTDPVARVQDFLEAVVVTADRFASEATSLNSFTDMMSPDWVPTVGGTPYEGNSRGPDHTEGLEWEDHRYGPTDPYSLTGEGARSEDELPGGENYDDPNGGN